jgi:hypothetical protein
MTANNVRIQNTSQFGKGGAITQVERVTFYVGDHGPFSHDFPAGQDNTVAIRQYIDAKVSYINGLVGSYGE